jgi:hypothetical protein
MEVHHPHHPTHKKKWSEYLVEFFMLFFAVTLGFFAENVREHQVVVEKKNQNLEAMVEDLKIDAIQLKTRAAEYTKAVKVMEEMKYASYQYNKNQLSEDAYVNYIVNQCDTLGVGDSFFCTNSAYKNTIASGSLSVIQSAETKKLIAEYYEELSVKLSDNNRNLDAELNEYVINTLQFGNMIDSDVRVKYAKMSHQEAMNDFKNIPSYRVSITSPDFRIHTNKFEMRCEYYLYLIHRFIDTNQKLLNSLEAKHF